MTDQSIEKVFESIIKGLSPFLHGMGFRLKKKKTFMKSMEDCNQELNVQFRRLKGQEAGYVEVCPNIIFENVEKMAAILKGDVYKKGWPTAAANIGNLQPEREFIEWPLTLTADVSGLVEIVTSHIEKIAKPFWQDFSNLDGLINGYEVGDPRLTLNGHSYRWRLLAAYCIIGEYEKAVRTLNDWTTSRPTEPMVEKVFDRIKQLKQDSPRGAL